MSLTDGLFVPIPRVVTSPDPSCGGYFRQAAAGNDGKFFLISDLAGCSGSTPSVLYDMRDHSAVGYLWFYFGIAGASGDGSRIYAGSSSVTPDESVMVFDSLSDTASASATHLDLRSI